jgi:hypothetical protein
MERQDEWMLPDFVAEHWQDVVRLDYRSGFVRRKV